MFTVDNDKRRLLPIPGRTVRENGSDDKCKVVVRQVFTTMILVALTRSRLLPLSGPSRPDKGVRAENFQVRIFSRQDLGGESRGKYVPYNPLFDPAFQKLPPNDLAKNPKKSDEGG